MQGYGPPGYGQQPMGQPMGYPPPGPGYLHAPSTGHVPQPQVDGGQWMLPPGGGIPNCPPGLEYLTAVDQLLIHQKVELLEAFVGYESGNKYSIKNSMGQKIFYAAEGKKSVGRANAIID